jgi:hypothetical protein
VNTVSDWGRSSCRVGFRYYASEELGRYEECVIICDYDYNLIKHIKIEKLV